jgi:hypothetical protein
MVSTRNSALRMCSYGMEFGKRQREMWTNFDGKGGEAV